MRTFSAALIFAILSSCTKNNLEYLPIPGSDGSGSQISSELVINSIQFIDGQIQCSFINDTLCISAVNATNSLLLKILTDTLHDTTYLLDGKNGNVTLYGTNNIVIGTLSGNFRVGIDSIGNNAIWGFFSGSLSTNGAGQGSSTVSGNYSNLYVVDPYGVLF